MKYFTVKELTASEAAQRHKVDNTPSEGDIERLHNLATHVLDPIRELAGRPVYITSGFRSPQLNEIVGGVPGSQHTKGEAADFTIGCRRENRELFRRIIDAGIPFDQLIEEKNGEWLHVSCREDVKKNRRQALRR